MNTSSFSLPELPAFPDLIIGLGVTGFALVEYYVAQNRPCIVLDSRENPPNLAELKNKYPHIPVHIGSFSPDILKQAKLVILSPGIPKDHPELMAHLACDAKIIGDIELFMQQAKAPIVSITGSNGKSTVTTLLGEMAKVSGKKVGVGGNLGLPALSMLDDKKDLYVLELSSFQLETTYSMHSEVATILNISPDHMDRYPTLESYLQAKLRILINAKKLVINRDDLKLLARLPKDLPSISFGLDKPNAGSFGIEDDALVFGNQKILPISDLKIFGKHNVANVLAALALGASIDLPLKEMVSAIRKFRGLSHRSEWVRDLNGVRWINDSKGTNVGATNAAIQGLGPTILGKWVLIAGGIGKNADFSELKPTILQYCRAVVLIGEAAHELYELLHKDILCLPTKDFSEAVALAAKNATSGDGVLLSPACASFDMFKNFEERGDVFKRYVLALPN